MNIQKLNEALDVLRKNLGKGLISTDIVTLADAQSIIGWHTNPAACALFSQITTKLNSVLKESNFPEIGRYFFMDLTEEKIALVVPMDEYIWIMLLDSANAPLGLLLNVVLPKVLESFEEALVG